MKLCFKKGAVDIWMIMTFVFIALAVAAGGLAVWSFINYNDQKDNVDSKVALAVAQAKKTQSDSDESKFEEREKLPNKEFVGPDDYGRVTFSYPKTWSAYIATDVSSNGGDYSAYLNPDVVPTVSDTQQFGLRVSILSESYDSIISNYQSLVQSGSLSSTAITENGKAGVRLDGKFTDNIRGSAAIFKIRDKTLVIRTDANTFSTDFENIIKTLKFNS
jgi:hypothetical protein